MKKLILLAALSAFVLGSALPIAQAAPPTTKSHAAATHKRQQANKQKSRKKANARKANAKHHAKTRAKASRRA